MGARQELDKAMTVAPDGRRRSDKELKTAREQIEAAATNFLDRFPDNPRKWEAKWLQASNTADHKKGEMVTKELVTSADAPPELRKSAGEQLLMRFIIGQGQSGQPEICAARRQGGAIGEPRLRSVTSYDPKSGGDSGEDFEAHAAYLTHFFWQHRNDFTPAPKLNDR
jgi:hypothetical protein